MPVSNPPLVTPLPPEPLTVSATEVAWLPDAAVPVTVMVPEVADGADSVKVEDPPAVTDVGMKDAVTPDGIPVAERDTVCAVPDVTALPPWVIVLPAGK